MGFTDDTPTKSLKWLFLVIGVTVVFINLQINRNKKIILREKSNKERACAGRRIKQVWGFRIYLGLSGLEKSIIWLSR